LIEVLKIQEYNAFISHRRSRNQCPLRTTSLRQKRRESDNNCYYSTHTHQHPLPHLHTSNTILGRIILVDQLEQSQHRSGKGCLHPSKYPPFLSLRSNGIIWLRTLRARDAPDLCLFDGVMSRSFPSGISAERGDIRIHVWDEHHWMKFDVSKTFICL
jgi:hypothetical protein